MTGTNHAMTGGVIGLIIGGPLAIPVAFVSHFVLDAMPHLGYEEAEDRIVNRNRFLIAVTIDGVILAIIFSAGIIYGLPWYVFVSMLAAMSPDFVWIYRFIFEEKMGKIKPGSLTGLNKFHSDIQTRESPRGIWMELVWFIMMLILTIKLY